MPLIGSALGHHLDLRANRTIKVSGLAERVNPEFFNALDRSRDDPGSHAVKLSAGRAGKIVCVADLIAGHVVAVLAAIDGERVLVTHGAGNLTGGRHARLQGHERAGVATEIW